ncbi:DotU family type VI secretion system protein [soil metagenome]
MSTPNDPFAALGAAPDRPFAMPTPGQRPAAAAAAMPTAAATGPEVARDFPSVDVGLNPLLALANKVLAIIPTLRATTQHAAPAQLKEQLAASIRDFERSARDSGLPAERVMAARYILCTVLDEVAASTPWGGSGAWAHQSLLATFHNETWGGEKVFQVMARLAENVPANRDLLELIYACLVLGFQGRYRVVDGGAAQLDAVRERLAQLLKGARGDYARPLSNHVASSVPRRSPFASWLPFWVTAMVCAAVLTGVLFGALWLLGSASDPVYSQIQSIRMTPPVPPPPPQPAPTPRLAQYLVDDIKARLVDVRDEVDRSVVTIRGDGLFDPGSADLSRDREQLMGRIAEAIGKVQGRVIVTGHTDDQAIRSVRFPSNWHLSQSRAQTVRDIMTQRGVAPERITAEGRADSEPLAPNDTPANRSLNRRVEITVMVGR